MTASFPLCSPINTIVNLHFSLLVVLCEKPENQVVRILKVQRWTAILWRQTQMMKLTERVKRVVSSSHEDRSPRATG